MWALYSEYYAALYLIAIVGAVIAIGTPRRREAVLFGLLPFVALVPWLGQLARSHNDLGKTKLAFVATSPTPSVLRNAVVPLFFGEHGAAASSSVRSAQAILVIAVLAYACVIVRVRCSREAFWLLPGVMIAAVLLQLVVTAASSAARTVCGPRSTMMCSSTAWPTSPVATTGASGGRSGARP